MGELRQNTARQNGGVIEPPVNDCRAMMQKLREVDFALVELNLYLDAYPDSSSALEYYHRLMAERARLCDAINRSGMPITMRDNVSRTTWNWVNGPWPWQTEAN